MLNNQHMTQSEIEDIEKKTKILLFKKIMYFMPLVIPIAIGLLYVIGSAYHLGYSSSFGIPDDLFPKSMDVILFKGSIAFARSSNFIFMILSLYFLFAFFLIFYDRLTCSKLFLKLKSKLPTIKKIHITYSSQTEVKILKTYFLMYPLIIVLLVSSVLMIILLCSYSYGKKLGHEQKAAYDSFFQKYSHHESMSLKEFPYTIKTNSSMGKRTVEGYIIESDQKFLAVYTSSGIDIFNIDSGVEIELLKVG